MPVSNTTDLNQGQGAATSGAVSLSSSSKHVANATVSASFLNFYAGHTRCLRSVDGYARRVVSGATGLRHWRKKIVLPAFMKDQR